MPKPSAGCKECKRRKVKCDERRGFMGCSNCLKQGIDCSGATSKVDSIIRDETAKTANKFVVVGSSSNSRAGDDPDTRLAPEISSALEPQLPQSPSNVYDLDELALELFYSSYCLQESPRKSVQEFKQIGNGSLFAAIKALGLELMEERSDFQFMSFYNAAIVSLNGALASPTMAKDDSTLLATTIMSAIEMKAAPQMSLDDYFNHIRGASALLIFRGPDQVLTKLGAALYMQMSAQIYLSCLFAHQGLPDGFRQLREQIAVYVKEPPLPCWKEHGVMMRFVDFRFTAEMSLQQEHIDCDQGNAIIFEALEIYEELSSIFETAPPFWQFRSIASNLQPWTEKDHIYESFIAAQSWTSYRLTTVILFDIVTRIMRRLEIPGEQALSLSEDSKLYTRNADHIVREAAMAIISSAPQQVDWLSLHLAQSENQHKRLIRLAPESFKKSQLFHCEPFLRGPIEESTDLPFVLFPAGISIYQAMYLAATVSATDEDATQTLASALGSIAAETGIKQAQQLCPSILLEWINKFNERKGQGRRL